MSNDNADDGSGRRLSEVLGEIRAGFSDVINSDLALARVELRETTGKVRRDAVRAAIFAGVALLGVPPFMAFLVIGLGSLLGGNYWLGALLISSVFFGVGGGIALASARRLARHDVTFPHTRRAIDHEITVVNRKLREIAQKGEKTRRAA
jgi:uncharacterized membrane protein YqjE